MSDTNTKKLVSSCVICEKELESAMPSLQDETYSNQPYGAIMCSSSGNYGSTVFDPVMGGQVELIFNICDECLVKKRGLFLLCERVYQRPKFNYKGFDPDTFDW